MPTEDLRRASQQLVRALGIRERYMTQSNQSFPDTAARFLCSGAASSTVRHGVRTHIHGQSHLSSVSHTCLSTVSHTCLSTVSHTCLSTVRHGVRTHIHGQSHVSVHSQSHMSVHSQSHMSVHSQSHMSAVIHISRVSDSYPGTGTHIHDQSRIYGHSNLTHIYGQLSLCIVIW